MRVLFLITSLLIVNGCSEDAIEEFAFRKTIEFDLLEKCEEIGRGCAAAVEKQIKSCMIKSDWKAYVDSDTDDDKEVMKFVDKFYPCFKDAKGEPYF
jgi:hypothetical protein